jgi:hypothetical protein
MNERMNAQEVFFFMKICAGIHDEDDDVEKVKEREKNEIFHGFSFQLLSL